MRTKFTLQKFVRVTARYAGALSKDSCFARRITSSFTKTVCDFFEGAPNRFDNFVRRSGGIARLEAAYL